jgi:hypothetical protein
VGPPEGLDDVDKTLPEAELREVRPGVSLDVVKSEELSVTAPNRTLTPDVSVRSLLIANCATLTSVSVMVVGVGMTLTSDRTPGR